MRPRIVTFVNADYIPVAQNWLRAMQTLGLEERVTVVSLDDETRDALRPQQILHRPITLDGSDLGSLWAHRIDVMRAILAKGEAIIHSDVDAVWLRNPLPDIEECGAPAVFSQGTVWPPDIHRLYGLVLCCGFFYLSSQRKVLDFLDHVASRVAADRDDQIAVNRTVADMVDSWAIEAPYEIPFADTSFLASRNIIRSRPKAAKSETMAIAVLPHHAYPRILDRVTNETVVAHPLSGKTLSDKKACLANLGLWLT